MFKRNWRIARRLKDDTLFVNEDHKFWTKRGAASAAFGLNQTFGGLDGLAKALGGRFFFAIHVKGVAIYNKALEGQNRD